LHRLRKGRAEIHCEKNNEYPKRDVRSWHFGSLVVGFSQHVEHQKLGGHGI